MGDPVTMRMSVLIIAILAILCIAYFIWQMVNSKRAGRSRRNQRKRKSDVVKLTRADKAAYRQAEKLFQQGNFRGCAKALESLGLLRESITILEKAGLIREAADTLIRIQRPNRAGSLLARHGLWKEAMECFKRANMPLEVGKACRELGDLPTAIPYFLEAKAFAEAAECYLELGKHHDAARLFLQVKDFDRAIEQYLHLVDRVRDTEKANISEEEIAFITKKLVENKVDTRLADILVAKKRMAPLLIEFIKADNIRSATAAYLRNTSDIGPELIAYNDFTRPQTMLLGALFANVGVFEYSGMVYERLEEFEKAGESFEKGELFERAAYCYERAKNKTKSTEMRIMVASHGPDAQKSTKTMPMEPEEKKTPPPKSINLFSINDTGTDTLPKQSEMRLPPKMPPKKSAVPPPQVAFLGQEEEKFEVANPNVNWDPFYQAEFLVDLSTTEQQTLQKICHVREFHKDAVILDYNHAPQGIYFLLTGEVTVFKRDKAGNEIASDRLQPSDTFGELWLLRDQLTKVKFAAKVPSLLGCIKRADFEHLMDENGAIARKLYKRYAQKLMTKLLEEQNRLRKKSAS